jgi:hypothetical protein
MIIFFKDRALKQNCNDTVYLKYRRKAQKFYYNRTLEYLKSEKLRIEVRYEDRKQNDAYSSLSCIVSIIALCISILNFCISENERGSVLWYIKMILVIIFFGSFLLVHYNLRNNKELIQCRIALQVLDELIAEKEESKTANGAKQYNVTIVSK